MLHSSLLLKVGCEGVLAGALGGWQWVVIALPVHAQPPSVSCSALKCLISLQCSWHAQVMPWVFIMWGKKGKSCQSTSLMQVCQMTSAAEENLVLNHMQIGPRLLVMPWCQLWFLIHYLIGFNAICSTPFSSTPTQNFWACFDFICGNCILNNKHTSPEVYCMGDFLHKLS